VTIVSAVDEGDLIERCYESGWTDGLPVVPPTEERVRAFLDAAGLEPGQVLGEVPERRRIVTAEKVAANAVLAGCLPAYMPVVVAAVRALCDPRANAHSATLSTSGSAPLLVVNGPVRHELGLNGAANLFGPGVRANATIGRTLRLVIMNVLGGRTGSFDRSSIGHPGKYAYCIAEDEEGSPWEPYHVSCGFDADTSLVTLVHCDAVRYVRDDASRDGDRLLTLFATVIKACSHTGGSFVVVVNPDHRAVLAGEGWTREAIRDRLLEQARISVAELKRTARVAGDPEPGDEDTQIAMARTPEDLILLAGGGPGVFSAVVPPWSGGRLTRPAQAVVERMEALHA
jgi:hypothetical protein